MSKAVERPRLGVGGTSFLDPWLWPTDAPVGGPGLLQSMQSNMQHPFEQPMKIVPMYGQRQEQRPRNFPQLSATAEPLPGASDAQVQGPLQHSADEWRAEEPPTCGDFGECRWHKSAETVGVISNDGHVFTKTAGPRRSRVSDRGARVELASICMVFDASLRCGGVHRYCYQIMEGELGAADGAGFVFDSKVRRNNIQRMRSVFLNQRGRICLRNNQQVTKLQAQLPPLTVGVCLTLLIDLDSMMAQFNISNAHGVLSGSADVSLVGLFDMGMSSGQLRSGFFCAVVTGSITIGIH